MGMKTKGVAFNMDDPDQKELFEYAMERTNFSAYVKRLIQSDRDSKRRKATGNPVVLSSNKGGIRFTVD
jgi:hypothetical protein